MCREQFRRASERRLPFGIEVPKSPERIVRARRTDNWQPLEVDAALGAHAALYLVNDGSTIGAPGAP
jgi:hypothetical protein